MKKMDFSVYVITASVPHLGRKPEDVAGAVARGGATVIQFRDKTMNDAEFADSAVRIITIARAAGVPCIVNDRVEIALEVGADGVHVGHDDADVRNLRKRISTGMIVGASATSYDEALEMYQAGADYLGVGPIFPTSSKGDATRPIGLSELARICRDVSLPVVAIGGISRENICQIADAGASGAAVIAAVAQAKDMTAATAELKFIWLASTIRGTKKAPCT
jgi:thiamine-phosphate pyrophosphorylase